MTHVKDHSPEMVEAGISDADYDAQFNQGGGADYPPQFDPIDELPGVGINRRTGRYVSLYTGQPATPGELVGARANYAEQQRLATETEQAGAQQLRSIPTSSSSVSQSYSDPAALQLSRDTLAENIRASLAQEARDEKTQRFNEDKLRVETERGDAKLALQTQQLIESQQQNRETNRIAREQMQQSLQLADRNIAQQREEAHARATEGVANRHLNALT